MTVLAPLPCTYIVSLVVVVVVVYYFHKPYTRAHCFAQRKRYLGTRRDAVSNCSPPILKLCICLWYETPSIARDHASPTGLLHFVQGPAVTDANDFSGRSAASAPLSISDSGTSAAAAVRLVLGARQGNTRIIHCIPSGARRHCRTPEQHPFRSVAARFRSYRHSVAATNC